jgi:predicted kinase
MSSSTGGRLIMVCGLPGSGKTTLARSLEDTLGAVRLCPDDWMDALGINLYDEKSRDRIETLQWNLAQQLLQRGLVVIIEWGTWARSERDTLRVGARALGASVELRHVTALPEVLLDRIQRRARENPPISLDAMYRWFDLFQVPTADELAQYDPPLGAGSDSPRK